MTLKEYLLEQPYEQIALLWFEGGQIRCKEYGINDYILLSFLFIIEISTI